MKKDTDLERYQLFYLEVPHRLDTDPLNDISTDILDEHEVVDYNEFQGLSDAQVSEIARDSLRDPQEQFSLEQEAELHHTDSEQD